MSLKENKKKELIRWDRFQSLFREEISKTSDDRPNVRYWKSSDLVKIITAIRLQHRAELLTTFSRGKATLLRLEEVGWVKPIAITWDAKQNPTLKLYQIQLYSNDAITTDPLELLQGYEPKGVVCYFGALQHYDLTTQIPPFYHIARVRSGPLPTLPTNEPTTKPTGKPARAYNPMGTALFTLDGLQFYETSRYPALMPGVQVRLLSGRSGIRITDLEQTLLDTLTHPLQCGGSAVVFEAWDRVADRIDSIRLLVHLEAINRTALWRRAAAMLTLTQILNNDSTLRYAFEEKLSIMGSLPEHDELPLLPDHEFSQLDPTWRVRIP
jgi:predicted transcriptional regulator of viral defense system